MNLMKFGLALAITIGTFLPTTLCAQESDTADTTRLLADHSATDTLAKTRNPFKWIGRYLNRTNKPNNKKFDVSVLLGPNYNVTTKFGIGALAAGLYSWDRSDPTLPKSNVSLFGNASTSGMFLVGLRGNNYLPHERYRLDYTLFIYTTPNDFWGIGYDNGSHNADSLRTEYHRVAFRFQPEFLFRLSKGFYAGPMVDFEHTNAYRFSNNGQRLLEGQSTCITNFGAGIDITHDTRDFPLNAYRGHYLQLVQMFYPRFMGNGDYSFSRTEVSASKYVQVWRGGVLAGEFHTQLNYGNVPWTMMANVGTGNRMRGYYAGRYRDKNIVEAQVELRQRIHGRYGAVMWIGAANIFPEFGDMRLRHTLPNYGIGYRWEFKKRMNVRFDLGFTKNKPSLAFNINEAF